MFLVWGREEEEREEVEREDERKKKTKKRSRANDDGVGKFSSLFPLKTKPPSLTFALFVAGVVGPVVKK